MASQLNKKDRRLYWEFLQDTLYPTSSEPAQPTTSKARSSSSIFISKNLSSNNVAFNCTSSTVNTNNNNQLDFEPYDLNYLMNSNALDMDDPDDENDPDFIITGHENADLEDREYDFWIHVPKKEAVDLVKDAIEHQDILSDEMRNSRHKSRRFITDIEPQQSSSSVSQSQQQPTSTNYASPLNQSNVNIYSNLENSSCDQDNDKLESETQELNESGEYVPRFNSQQKKMLEEQLRNHVQIATQVCLATYCSKEYKSIYNQSLNLLKDLKNLKQSDLPEGERHIQLSRDFNIRNLDEALQIIEDIHKLDHSEFNVGPRNEFKMPRKFLQMILTSPVFYNIYLLPNTNKSSVCMSIFKKSQFCDAEKILVTMGFNKFKHLDRQQAVECIHKYMMPHKSCEEIKKQINSIIDHEERQKKLKSLLMKQKNEKMTTLENYEFDEEIHYRSPFEQAEKARLPPMYTMMIESLRMEEIKRLVKDNMNKKQKEAPRVCTSTQITRDRDLSDVENSYSVGNTSNTNREKQSVLQEIITTSDSVSQSPIKPSRQRKRVRSASPEFDRSFISSLDFNNSPLAPEKNTRTSSNMTSSQLVESTPVSHVNTTPGATSIPIVYSASNMMQLLSNPASMMQPLMNHPSSMVINSNMAHAAATQQHPQLASAIPPNFNGIILFQPTFYVQCTDSNANKSQQAKKFRQIMPKSDPKQHQAKK